MMLDPKKRSIYLWIFCFKRNPHKTNLSFRIFFAILTTLHTYESLRKKLYLSVILLFLRYFLCVKCSLETSLVCMCGQD